MDAKLSSSLDAKKNKPGDRVEAQTISDVKQGGNVVLPKGSKLIGRVTQVQARENGQNQSALGITFRTGATAEWSDHADTRRRTGVGNVAIRCTGFHSECTSH